MGLANYFLFFLFSLSFIQFCTTTGTSFSLPPEAVPGGIFNNYYVFDDTLTNLYVFSNYYDPINSIALREGKIFQIALDTFQIVQSNIISLYSLTGNASCYFTGQNAVYRQGLLYVICTSVNVLGLNVVSQNNFPLIVSASNLTILKQGVMTFPLSLFYNSEYDMMFASFTNLASIGVGLVNPNDFSLVTSNISNSPWDFGIGAIFIFDQTTHQLFVFQRIPNPYNYYNQIASFVLTPTKQFNLFLSNIPLMPNDKSYIYPLSAQGNNIFFMNLTGAYYFMQIGSSPINLTNIIPEYDNTFLISNFNSLSYPYERPIPSAFDTLLPILWIPIPNSNVTTLVGVSTSSPFQEVYGFLQEDVAMENVDSALLDYKRRFIYCGFNSTIYRLRLPNPYVNFNTPCPITSPVLCPNGNCVTTPNQCTSVSNICTPGEFPCSVSSSVSCASSVDQCKANALPCNATLCWDGSCVSSSQFCPVVPSCPLDSLRCNGQCIFNQISCNTTSICSNSSDVVCPDGTCASSVSSCPEFNGCLNIECANGFCVNSIDQCFCPNSNLIQCWDGSCASNVSQCVTPPWEIKVAPISVLLNINESQTVPVYDSTFSNVLWNLNFPSFSFNLSACSDTTTVPILIQPVADSVLRQVTFPGWEISDNLSLRNVLSPVLSLQVPSCVQQPFLEYIELTVNVTNDIFPPEINALFMCFINGTEWQCLDQVNITISENYTTITGLTNHFTRFGIIAPAGLSNVPSSTSNIILVPFWVFIVIILIILLVFITCIVLIVFLVKKLKSPSNNLLELQAEHVDESLFIKENDIQLGVRLGGGAFGEVFEGTYQATKVALKKLHDESQFEEFISEAKILIQLRHPNVVFYYGLYKSEEGQKYIVTELLSLGSLKSLLSKNYGKFSVAILIHLCKLSAAGMSYLEDKKIVHRDLAVRNLLVKKEDNTYVVKVGDFGLSRPVEKVMDDKESKFPVKWTALEAMEGKYSTASDVWSFGIVVWEIFKYGEEPYPGLKNLDVITKLKEGYRLPAPENVPDSLYKLMISCWNEDPSRRPSFNFLYASLLRLSDEFPVEDEKIIEKKKSVEAMETPIEHIYAKTASDKERYVDPEANPLVNEKKEKEQEPSTKKLTARYSEMIDLQEANERKKSKKAVKETVFEGAKVEVLDRPESLFIITPEQKEEQDGKHEESEEEQKDGKEDD